MESTDALLLFLQVLEGEEFDIRNKCLINMLTGPHGQHFTFVGDFDNLYEHGKMLLERVDAWEQYGKLGWALSGVRQVPAPKATETS